AVGFDSLVSSRSASHLRPDPARRDANALVIRRAIEEWALDALRFERLMEDLRAARRGSDDLVRRRSDAPLLERDLFQIDFQLLREDLIDRVDFEQPARRHVH